MGWMMKIKVSDQTIKNRAINNPIVAQFELEKRSAVHPIYIQIQESIVPMTEGLIGSCSLMEVKPSYNGTDDIDSLRTLMESFVQLPETDVYLEGKVYLQFEISSDGNIGAFEIKRSLRSDYDQKAIEAVNSLSKWQPALSRNTVSSCFYVIPISFNYPKDQDE
jgi:TonB family protein